MQNVRMFGFERVRSMRSVPLFWSHQSFLKIDVQVAINGCLKGGVQTIALSASACSSCRFSNTIATLNIFTKSSSL